MRRVARLYPPLAPIVDKTRLIGSLTEEAELLVYADVCTISHLNKIVVSGTANHETAYHTWRNITDPPHTVHHRRERV
ncbi:hypothetical protein OPQ81_000941 [Rhizoctonia solani]|nr:hypothetical protein OPQ81_000941 [Rhizoctonia solani]